MRPASAIDELLRRRAAALAAPVDTHEGTEYLMLGTFTVGRQTLGVPMEAFLHVFEVLRLVPIPRSPEYFLGVCVHEGAVLTLANTCEFLQLRHIGAADFNNAVVVGSAERAIAFGAQNLTGIVEIPTAQVRPISQEHPCLNRAYHEMLIIDPAALFRDPRLNAEAGV